MNVVEQHDAGRLKWGPEKALHLARSASKVVAAKGRGVQVFDMGKNPPDDSTLLAAILGPTGNLRAPTLRRGKTLMVGFNPAEYDSAFG